MDIFYYWKNFAEDLANDRIGWFRSDNQKLKEFQEGYPDYLWVFKTPKGKKGQVQLLSRLYWANAPVVKTPRAAGEQFIYYDPCHSESVSFVDSDDADSLDVATAWVRKYLPVAIVSNFQGMNGQHALRGPALAELRSMARRWRTEPFRNK